MFKYIYFIFMLLVIGLAPITGHTDDDDNAKPQTDPNSVPGITATEIVLGSVLPLDGPGATLGRSAQLGLNRALVNQVIGERKLRIVYADDLYDPLLTPLRVQRLLSGGIFAMIGNVGTATAAAALPILKQAGIPAVGFLTGSQLLRTGDGLVLNYRASYAQETAALLDAAFAAGIKPKQVCAYVQNDAYGRDGLLGVQEGLKRVNTPPVILTGLKTLLDNSNGDNSTDNMLIAHSGIQSPVNADGPVGIYTRGTLEIMPGYNALKNWEHKTGYNCKLVVAVGLHQNLAYFIHTARSLGEDWIFALVSFAGADDFRNSLKVLENSNVAITDTHTHNIIMSQVVPTLDSKLPIVEDARQALGENFGFLSLEGYIVGRIMLKLLQDTPLPLTQIALMNQAKQSHFDLGGLDIDFTSNGYQGSNLVTLTKLTDSGYISVTPNDWQEMLAWHPSKPAQADVPKIKPIPVAKAEVKVDAPSDAEVDAKNVVAPETEKPKSTSTKTVSTSKKKGTKASASTPELEDENQKKSAPSGSKNRKNSKK